MIHSLLGQSEVLTICGTFLAISGQSGIGFAMIGLGIFGSFTRFCINTGFINKQIETEDNENEKTIKQLIEKMSAGS